MKIYDKRTGSWKIERAENEDKEISQPLFQVHHQENQMDGRFAVV